MTNPFDDTRKLLQRIRRTVGDQGLVALAWDGDVLKLSMARPETGKKMFIATFDSEDDFIMRADDLIGQFVAQATSHFMMDEVK
jgi:hypothetical protein